MYQPQKDARLQSPNLNQTIRGNGWFDEGIYNVIIKEAQPEDNCLTISWEDITGNLHIEKFWLQNTIVGYGLTSEWRAFRAAMFPDLKCQKIIDTKSASELASLLEGLKAIIEITKTSGWTIVKDKREYVAVNEKGEQLTRWYDNIAQTKQAVIKLGITKALHKISNIEGHPLNVAVFLRKTQPSHSKQEDMNEIHSNSKGEFQTSFKQSISRTNSASSKSGSFFDKGNYPTGSRFGNHFIKPPTR